MPRTRTEFSAAAWLLLLLPAHLEDVSPAVFTNVTLHLILVDYLQGLLPVPTQQQAHPSEKSGG
jgi:hypothetical protein